MSFPAKVVLNRYEAFIPNINEQFEGIYNPQFKRLGLSSSTGLTTHTNGGLVATVDNVSGSGYQNLPKVIDRTKKWRFAVKYQLNDTRDLTVQLCESTNDFKSAVKLTASLTRISLTIGGVTLLNQFGFGTIPSGSIFWLTVASDGNKVTTAHFIETPTSIANTSTFQDSAYQKLVYKTDSFDLVNGAFQVFSNLSRINFTNASTTNRIIGTFVNIGSLSGPVDNLLNPPFILQPVILNDSTSWIMANGEYGGNKKSHICFLHHPNGNPGDILNQPNAFATIQKLWANGYTVIGMSGLYGTHSDYLESTSSNWGAPAGLYYRKSLVDWVRTNMPLTQNMVHLGLSMGVINALQYEAIYPGTSKAIIAISGVFDLSDSFTNRGFSTQIQKGFGKWYVCIQAGTGQAPASSPTFWTPLTLEKERPGDLYYSAPYIWKNIYGSGTAYSVNDIVCVASSGTVSSFQDSDPILNTHKYIKIPIHARHGSSDSTIPISQTNNFYNNLIADGGIMQKTVISGASHLDASIYDPTEILNFLSNYV